MAQRVQVLLEDDIQGGTADETVTFALDGVTYEIDLNQKNSTQLRSSMDKYITAGRRVAGRRKSGTGKTRPGPGRSAARTDREQLAKIREWARANGYTVSDKGRIPQEVREAFSRSAG